MYSMFIWASCHILLSLLVHPPASSIVNLNPKPEKEKHYIFRDILVSVADVPQKWCPKDR
jgi:hypothetical protein